MSVNGNNRDLNRLRELLRTESATPKRERLPASLYAPGVPRGAVVEISGSAQTAWVLSVLREHSESKVLWVEKDLRLFPPHLAQVGVDPERIAFVECDAEAFGVLRRGIRSQVFPFIVTTLAFEDERIHRALRLLSEKAGATLFLLCPKPSRYWTVALQLEADWGRPDLLSEIQVRVIRDKAGNALPGTELLVSSVG